ncbi:membrane-bound alkaline phosphatase [Drosophila sulfurigaster albostrigata]|uniref:membrane-bound alkaline phosphatase n=1 Tax=Drosophila sulfurigaster albostrigata TaxID=89887 RepID=UPI002D21E668|nr:membrane-bound alkaline phosphatase [Drosophila sulfurigaster albostrigata]
MWTLRLLTALLLAACVLGGAVPGTPPVDEEEHMHPDLQRNTRTRARIIEGEDTQDYWLSASKAHILEKLSYVRNEKRAKNIILFLGDGMGLATLAAARSYIGGEEQKLSFEEFPYTGLSKTYCVDKIVPDSASTSTSYLCGVKANYGTIGVNAHVKRGDCQAMADTNNHVFSVGKWAMDAGKAAGLVTTTRVTHASPAGVYAHTADREWENNAVLEEACGDLAEELDDIAVQLIHGEVGGKLKVILGGGKRSFYDPEFYEKGRRTDGRNLVAEFEALAEGNTFVKTQKKLLKVNVTETDRLLGLFSKSHMHYHVEQLADPENNEPTLEEMTEKAIEMLQKEENGYFLFVEGGKIDISHHDTMARIALDETAEFSKAIKRARELTNLEDTLIVVTSDHSHTFSVGGYQARGSDIFGEAESLGTDGKPYLTLSYANGKSFDQYYDTEAHERMDPTALLSEDTAQLFPATAPLESETHGGEDVGVFASGPWAHLFTGVYEQNTIPHMLAFAACVGDGKTACD